MPHLRYLNLSFNHLSEEIPRDIWKNATYAMTIDASSNRLEGTIPVQLLYGAKNLQRLLLQNNQLVGDIDKIWSYPYQVSSLIVLRLQGNHFHGNIGSVTRDSWKSLQILDLSHNFVSLNISESPRILDTLIDLRELRLGNNNSTGALPTRVGFFSVLEILDLSHSNLRGEISPDIFTSEFFPSLRSLDLSSNFLSGPVPTPLTRLHNLTHLNLSGNCLSGQLPQLPQALRVASFFSPDNEGLCGDPLPRCPAHRSPRTELALWQLLAVVGACVVISVGSCALLGWRWIVYYRKHQQDADLIVALQDTGNAALMPLRELRRATSNFCESFQIGEGGFGSVYTGKLSDGTTVAIKKCKREGSARDKHQFLNEVRILSQVNHRNLVQLLGCCLENKIALLVFEFVPNGTLQQHLQGVTGEAPLSWRQRLQIAMQTADALAYLHSAANPPIFHRDVKAANILLDENLNAKVADFGISKLASLEATHVSTIIQGTIGYIDPEYYTSFQLTGKSDVYSFGVVLLELISAQAPVDLRRGTCTEDASLVSWAIHFIKAGDLPGILDPYIWETFNSKPGQQSIASLAKLAVKCVEPKAKDRPMMRDVWKELQELWLQLDGHFNSGNCNHSGTDPILQVAGEEAEADSEDDVY